MFLTGLVAGIAATPHCLGMCGGFPLYLASSPRTRLTLLRQILFVTAKTFTYVFLGALAAAFGKVVLKDTPLLSLATLLKFAIGFLTVILGLAMLGVRIPIRRHPHAEMGADLVSSSLRRLFSSASPAAPFVIGLFAGFIPCPVPMGLLAGLLAAPTGSHSIPHGIALMAGLGLGTSPGLLTAGVLGAGIERKFVRVGMKAVGVVVLAIGLLSLGRTTTAAFHARATGQAMPGCCEDHAR
jgi:hypothetical protein